MTHNVGDTVYTEDGREAEYAGDIGGQMFVRYIMRTEDSETGPQEWPSEKLTPVAKVFDVAPMEKMDARILEALDRYSKIMEETVTLRQEKAELESRRRVIEEAAKKHPDIQTALDFLEGRITHVVVSDYNGHAIKTLDEVLVYTDDYKREDGLKLLCLFGFRKGKPPRWSINRYYEGGGSWTQIMPFHSEADAAAYVQRIADDAVAAWRTGKKNHGAERFLKSVATLPDDFLAHLASEKASYKERRIAALQAQISQVEAEE